MRGNRAILEGGPDRSGTCGRFDPEGRKNPEEERKQEKRRKEQAVEAATGLKRGSSPNRRKPANGLRSGRTERAAGTAGGMSEVAGQER